MFQKQNDLDLEIVLTLLKGESHLRALAKSIRAPPANVKRSADRLIADNALDARRSGRNRVFSLKRTIEAKEYSLAAEHYKALKCLKKYPYLAPLMEKALLSSNGMVVLFGSHASFSAKANSDVDLYCEKKLKDIGGRASVKTGAFDVSSPLIKEILLNHVIFRGADEFYERAGFFKEGC